MVEKARIGQRIDREEKQKVIKFNAYKIEHICVLDAKNKVRLCARNWRCASRACAMCQLRSHQYQLHTRKLWSREALSSLP